jgi:quinol monooxygenase YgiN
LNYYVYYKVEAARAKALRAEVQALLAAIERHAGVRGRWMRRRDDPSTYMEVYEGVTDQAAFEALLEREGAKLKLARKLERFEECA